VTSTSPTRRPRSDPTSPFALAIAGLAPIAVAALLVTVRSELVAANLALIMVLVVVGAAVIGGRAGGAIAAVMSVISYDFFLTKPYLSFRIESADDIETTILLLVIGLIVGQLVTIGRRRGRAAEEAHEEITRLHRVAELAAGGARAEDLIGAVEAEVMALLGGTACRYEEPPFELGFVRLERNGAVGVSTRRLVGDDFALPSEGIEIPVVGAGTQVGRLVLEPSRDVGVSLERRVVAVALADQLGAALAPAAPGAH
jgi:hypothetical protein